MSDGTHWDQYAATHKDPTPAGWAAWIDHIDETAAARHDRIYRHRGRDWVRRQLGDTVRERRATVVGVWTVASLAALWALMPSELTASGWAIGWCATVLTYGLGLEWVRRG